MNNSLKLMKYSLALIVSLIINSRFFFSKILVFNFFLIFPYLFIILIIADDKKIHSSFIAESK